jgi:predicted AAA+ superfamily ATPase
MELIASQIGQLITYDELARTISLDERTIQNYLWYIG